MAGPLIWFGADAKLLPTGTILKADGTPLVAISSAFSTVQTPFGTFPVATGADPLTYTGTTVKITGNSTTDTVNFEVAPAGSTGQIQANNAGVLAAIPGSTVLFSPNLSAGSVALAALGLGGAGNPSLVGVYRLQVRGGVSFQNSGGTSTNFVCDPSTGLFNFGDFSAAFSGGYFSVTSSYTLLAGGGQQVLLTTDTGARITLSALDGSVLLSNLIYSNFINVDGNGGVTVRATSDQGGLFADSSGYTYLGNYSAATSMIIDAAGNVGIATGGAAPGGTALLQVGPDSGTGGRFTFNFANIGGQTFFDVLSGNSGDACSIRVFTDTQCGEFAAIANPGEYFSNSLTGDTALKGSPAGGNRFLIGVGSGVSQVTVGSSGLYLSNLTSGRVPFASTDGLLIDNAGFTYVSGSGMKLNTVGEGFYLKEGTNARAGVATLVAGAVTVSTTKVTANSRIKLTIQSPGGTVGSVYVFTRTAGTSFQIKSTNAADTSVVYWEMSEPA